MQINDLAEYNCLMRHGQKEETHEWYWTDGNDVENTAVWTHALDDREVTFFGLRMGCGCTDYVCTSGGDALMVLIGGNKHHRGNYCDYDSSSLRLFICENII